MRSLIIHTWLIKITESVVFLFLHCVDISAGRSDIKTRMTTFIKAKLKKLDKYRVAINIIECHIISKLIFRRINIPKLFHVKNICENVKNQHVQNGRTDFCVTIIELLRFLNLT